MLDLRENEQTILATGRVDATETEVLRSQLYVSGKIKRREADFLVELHKRVQHRTPGFEKFFYQAIKDHILAHGRIDAEETAWLRRMLFADGKIDEEGRTFLHELKGKAKHVSREFEILFEESVKQPLADSPSMKEKAMIPQANPASKITNRIAPERTDCQVG